MFNNIQPRTREQRLAMRDKERIEQKRIEERCEGFKRNTDPFTLQKPDPTSDYFIPEEQRFDKNFSVHDKIAREAEYMRKLHKYEHKRQAQFERDNYRWEAMDDALRQEQTRIQKKAEIFLSAKRNKSSHPYNPLTLQYDTTAEGENLRQRDLLCQHRADLRGENIYTKGNSAWNPLTGQSLAHHYSTKQAPSGAPGGPTVPTYTRPF